MTEPEILAQIRALKDAWWEQAHSVITGDCHYQEGKLDALREVIKALQFQLVLQSPCYRLERYLPRFW